MKFLLNVSCLAAALCASAAHATIVTGYSEGQALSLSTHALNVVTVGVASGKASGSYSPDYSTSTGIDASLNGNVSANTGLTGVLAPLLNSIQTLVSAQSVVGVDASLLQATADGASARVEGTSQLDGANIGLGASISVQILYPVNLGTNLFFSLSVDQMSSLSAINGDGSADAHSVVTNLGLTLTNDGLTVLGSNASLLTNAFANLSFDLGSDQVGFNYDLFAELGVDAITDTLGLSLILNEKFEDDANCGNGNCVAVNALHLKVNPLNVNLAGVDLVLGHSLARATTAASPTENPMPEPGAMALVGLGLLGLALARRRS